MALLGFLPGHVEPPGMEDTTAAERLRSLISPELPEDSPQASARRLLVALEMMGDGIAMMRLNLRRQHPEDSAEQLNARLTEWLHTRPGAAQGDGEGVPAPDRFAGL